LSVNNIDPHAAEGGTSRRMKKHHQGDPVISGESGALSSGA